MNSRAARDESLSKHENAVHVNQKALLFFIRHANLPYELIAALHSMIFPASGEANSSRKVNKAARM